MIICSQWAQDNPVVRMAEWFRVRPPWGSYPLLYLLIHKRLEKEQASAEYTCLMFEHRCSLTFKEENWSLSYIPADREPSFSIHLFFVLLEFQISLGGCLSLGLQGLVEPLHQLVRVGLQFWNYCCHLGGWGNRSSQFLLVQHLSPASQAQIIPDP